ncbi:MAG: septum formation initiator family protein [Rhodobacterales bacterium]|nr:septum formation initiator family protein [Rhodobacterales bacterium]
MTPQKRLPIGAALLLFLALGMGLYFALAALQGDFGLFRRAQIVDEREILQQQLDVLNAKVARAENLALRLSDGYLDLDLLDQQARQVLGLLRADEIVIR